MVGAAIKDAYFSLEDKWFALTEKIPGISNAVNSLEDRGVPTFPAFIILIIIIIALISFLFIFNSGSPLSLVITDQDGNPVDGATVTVFFDGDEVAFLNTNSEGKANFILAAKTYEVKVEKENYGTITASVETGEEEELTITLDDILITKAVLLKTLAGQTISGNGSVTYSCEGESTTKTALYTDGRFNADFSTCSNINIISVSGHTVVTGRISFSGTENVVVDELTQNTGDVTVILSAQDLPNGLKIDLMGEDGIPQKTQTNNGSTVVFNDVATKRYYIIVSDSSGLYKTYNGKGLGEIKELQKDASITFNITLEKGTNSTISVAVKNTSGLPISGAQVKLQYANTLTVVETMTTGMTGNIVFDVPLGEVFVVTAEHPNYLVTGGESVNAGESKTITLVEANEENSRTITVVTKDPTNDPINNVRITLKKMDGTVVGEKNTGADGKAKFYNLEIGSYYAYAIKDGFDGVTSTSISLLPREVNELLITMDIGKGTIQLNVADSGVNALRGINIRAINYFTGLEEAIESTNEEGIATFDIRADKKVYFVLQSSGYMDYYTISTYPDEGSTIEKTIIMKASSGKMSVTMIGLYSSDAVVSNTDREVSQGTYTAKLLLEIPKGNFSEAGVHLRTGGASNNVTNIMEEDPAYIGEVYTSAKKILKGTTYTPLNGYSTDSLNFTSGNAKWIESVWKNPKEGIYEIEADVTITETNPNVGIDLWYRGWAKGSSMLQDPPNTNDGHEMYASANNYLLSSGAANLCGEVFCKSYSVQTISGNNSGKIQYITNMMSAKQDTSYVLMADLVNYSGKALSSSVLNITGSGIEIDGITVNGTEYDVDKEINLGTLGIDSFTQISVAFSTTKSGSGSIGLMINSATKTELEETIAINVKTNKKFELTIIPKEIIPYVTNTLFFEAIDGNAPLNGVSIEIKSGRDVLENVTTNNEGLANYELSSPSAGDVIKFTAKKEGYDEVVFEKEVDEQIVLLIPSEINETIKIGEVATLNQRVLIENGTVETLKITDVRFTGEMKDYLEITTDDIIGKTMSAEGDLNFEVKFKPNATAKKLDAPKTVQGQIKIDVEVVSAEQEFSQDLPVTIRLSMPGYLDSDECLSITPGSVEFITSTSEVTDTLTITNNCAAEGTNVALHNVTAKLNESSKYGTIFLSGAGFNSISLSDGPVELADYFANGEEELTLRFVPTSSADSGTQKVILTVEGKNIPDQGEEESVKAKVNVELTMSDLSKCITIEEPEDGISLDIAGWNLGYNRIVNSNMSSYAQQYQGFNQQGRGSSMPYGMQSAIPFMNTGGGSTAYEENSFIIKNDCALDVEIDLDPDSKLNVSEEEFEIASGEDETITVTPGYTLGTYNIKVNARVADSEDKKEKIDTVSVKVRRLGDIDDDCIRVSTSTLEFNSLIYESKKYKVFNYCYSSGIQLARGANAVTVQCDAPASPINPTQSVPYFQTGQQYQGLYQSGYPINNMYQNYNSYLGAQSCSSNACSMVSGTRVYTRIVSDDSSTETLTFEVMPSSQYMPQRKLFDARTQSYGIFNSIANIRDWATQTDARTRVYGRINVEYSNQYGTTQCKSFPVEIEDMWRLGESVDSLVNWGDTSASPGECVSQNQRDNSLNIKEYWKGAVPDGEFRDDRYTYIATPPAVTYGPASNTSNYPQNSYYQMLNNNDPRKANAKSKNCGYLDKLSDLSYQDSVGGVGINVDTLGIGSFQRETKGANLAVTLNRSGMTAPCVFIQIPVKAKLSRAATFESEEITWTLTALVLRKDISMSQIKDIQKDCLNASGNPIIPPIDNNKPTVDTGKCSVGAETFGYSRIGETNPTLITESQYNDYCENKFCNNSMLYYYLEKQYEKIDSAITDASITCDSSNKDRMISELYKEAGTAKITQCTNKDLNFYTKENGDAVVTLYPISEKVLKSNENEISIIKTDPEKSEIIALHWMTTVLDDVEKEEGKNAPELLIMINKVNIETNTFKETDATKLGMSKIGDNYYMPLNIYKELNESVYNKVVNSPTDACATGGDCVVTYCSSEKTIKPDTMKAISEYGSLVRGVIVGMESAEDKKAIYTANPKLDKIYKLARENKDVYITGVKEFVQPSEEFNKQFKIEHNTKFSNNSLTPGKYDYNVDAKYCESSTSRTMEIKLAKVAMDANESRAKDNIILQNGFDVLIDQTLQDTTSAILVKANTNGGIILHQRIPVQLTVSAGGGAKAILYHPTQSIPTSSNLIKWNATMTDTVQGNNFMLSLPSPVQPLTYNGIYYYPNNGSLSMTIDQGTGSVFARALALNSVTSPSQDIGNGKRGTIQMSQLKQPTLDDVIVLVRAQEKVCVSEDGQTISWNEAELVK